MKYLILLFLTTSAFASETHWEKIPMEINSGLKLESRLVNGFLETKGEGKLKKPEVITITPKHISENKIEDNHIVGFVKEEGRTEIYVLRYNKKEKIIQSFLGDKKPAYVGNGRKIKILFQVPVARLR